MSDEEALMQLVLDNNQGELSPLEIGIHALRTVPPAQGKKGVGLQAYADRLGRTKQYIGQVRAAAEVATTCQVNLTSVHDKAQHLAAVHKAPQAVWSVLVKVMLEKGWTAMEVAAHIGRLGEFDIPQRWQELFIPFEDVVARFLDGVFSPGTVQNLIAAVEATYKQIESYEVDAKPYLERLDQWLHNHAGGDAWDVRKVRQKQSEIIAEIEAEQRTVEESWCLGDWRDHLDKLVVDSAAAVVTDPPYGIAFQNRGKTTKREVLANDDVNAPLEVRESLTALYSKLKDDAHVFCFCHWTNEPEMRLSPILS